MTLQNRYVTIFSLSLNQKGQLLNSWFIKSNLMDIKLKCTCNPFYVVFLSWQKRMSFILKTYIQVNLFYCFSPCHIHYTPLKKNSHSLFPQPVSHFSPQIAIPFLFCVALKKKLKCVVFYFQSEPDSPEAKPLPRDEPAKEQWSLKLDVNEPVKDFYKRIPDMAYQVSCAGSF